MAYIYHKLIHTNLATDWSFTVKGVILLACGAALLGSTIFLIRGRRQAAKEVAK